VYIRGSNTGIEYKRNDQSFYKGTVVQNNDPEGIMRVKVYIPELSNEPLDGWLNDHKQKKTKFPGVNNKTDSWSDTAIFKDIKKLLPWAEPCLPLMGEHGPGRFFAGVDQGIGIANDTNYAKEALGNDVKPINLQKGTGASGPSLAYEQKEFNEPDANANPGKNSTGINNPHAYGYPPVSYPNASKGVFGVPNVGAPVWVFHYNGDLNFPVYFGCRSGYGDVATIMATKQGAHGSPAVSQDLPGDSENEPLYAEEDSNEGIRIL